MANSIDVGGARLRQMKKALGDNAPATDLRITAVIRKGASEATPATSADHFHVGDRLIGSYVAIERHFLRVRLHLQPESTPESAQPPSDSPLLGVVDDDHHLDAPGRSSSSWELDTTHMQPGGYVLLLQVVDRTRLASGVVTRWSDSVAIGFRLAPAPAETLSALSATPIERGFSHARRM